MSTDIELAIQCSRFWISAGLLLDESQVAVFVALDVRGFNDGCAEMEHIGAASWIRQISR